MLKIVVDKSKFQISVLWILYDICLSYDVV